ncbi:ARM repeat domain-containing protein [Chloropicon primus]|uniref:ARM repeat domain-containing protein n=1 Tax=Chloropicon primus TaxID=1764295 RepID=A0A5B8MFR8_9CHLO|nr:ARM repeat domain-containing protein [Chloropicon primus]UPQ98436.1 ARM repeat domain-containing protein [Chloropicon primus]|eukprot:QDZ19227.1 ARM repeat domain-containing protein [Chloropicon primus]
MTESSEDLYPIAVLIDELKNDDIVIRLNSLRRLTIIAKALGPERTREELIPFLSESTEDEDEALTVLAEELGNFVPVVGGVKFAFHLLPPLESLATVEETVVREKAVESLCKIAEQMDGGALELHYIPLVTRLAKTEWFTARVSSCGLFAVAYEKSSDEVKQELRVGFNELCKDETPMVRRAAAQQLGKYAEKLEKERLMTEVMTIFAELCEDDQDSVRLLAVGTCSALAKLLGKEGSTSKILPAVQKFSSDKSWRVRYMVAQQVNELCDVIGKEITMAELVTVYVNLLKDNEAEVRVAAAQKAGDFCGFVGGALTLTEILPCLKELSNDTSQHVRAAIAIAVMVIAPIFDDGNEIETNLLPIILTLLRDEFPDVRLNIIRNLEQVSKIIGIQLLQKNLLPAIVALAEDRHWRVRLAIINYFPLLARQLGIFSFNDILGKLCIQWLEDSVATIRTAAAQNLKNLAEDFGSDWVQEFVLPKMLDKLQHPHFLLRMTIMEAVGAMATVVSSEILQTMLLPELMKFNKDKVPNVRFHACRLMKDVIPCVDPAIVSSTIKPWLADMQDDVDHDVRFFAREAEMTIRG